MPPRSSSKKHFLVPAIGLLILGVLIFLGFRATDTPTTVAPGAETPTLEWPSEQVSKETITDSTKGYEITASYPTTKSAAITALFRDFVTDQIDSFKADTTAEEMPEGYRALTLDISYQELRNENADNYIFISYSDTGGAHGLSVTKTFSFIKTGKQLALADLFTNGVRGLGAISDIVKTDLMKREFADANWISEGSSPVEDNYQNFIIEADGVTFIFDQYQVAPYAAGVQKVTIPTSAFKSIANPEVFK